MKINLDLMTCRRLPGDIRRYVESVRKANEAGVIVFICLYLAALILYIGILAR